VNARTQTLSAIVLGASILCASPPARADDAAGAEAIAATAAARAKQGALRVAIDLYEDAYARAPRREYLREIGAIYDHLAHAGDSRDVRLAILYLERSLVDEGPTPVRADVEARLARLRLWKSRMSSEPQQPRPAPVPVRVLAYKPENTYEVALGPMRCNTPCTLFLPPGQAPLVTAGAGKIEQQVIIPDRPSQIRLQHPDSRSFVAGAVLVPVGLTVGASMWAVGFACGDSGCLIANLVFWPVAGLSMMVTGIVLLASGRSAPADANRVEVVARRKAPEFKLTSVGLAPTAGGASGGLTFSF
jgi:hypothetical protein